MIYSHSGDFGDLLAILPCLQKPFELVLTQRPVTGNRMTPERVHVLTPLLMFQGYISEVRHGLEPEGKDLDEWRNHYKHGLNLTDMCADWLGVPRPDRNAPWLTASKDHVAKVVISRSDRLNNPNFPWRDIANTYGRNAVFIGTGEEFVKFDTEFGKVPYYRTRTLWDAASVIQGCEVLICNQTCNRWIGEGLKVKLCVEQSKELCNTHWERSGAIYGNPFSGEVDLQALDTLINA